MLRFGTIFFVFGPIAWEFFSLLSNGLKGLFIYTALYYPDCHCTGIVRAQKEI